jgi:hypothetical protein
MAAKKTPTKKQEGKSVIAEVCAGLKIDPRVARRRLRAAGMKAPYQDANAVRKALAKDA